MENVRLEILRCLRHAQAGDDLDIEACAARIAGIAATNERQSGNRRYEEGFVAGKTKGFVLGVKFKS